mgnify:CR=1 FL=1
MYFVVNLKCGYVDFLDNVISIDMNDLHEITFKTNGVCWNSYNINDIVFFRQITENEYYHFTKH